MRSQPPFSYHIVVMVVLSLLPALLPPSLFSFPTSFTPLATSPPPPPPPPPVRHLAAQVMYLREAGEFEEALHLSRLVTDMAPDQKEALILAIRKEYAYDLFCKSKFDKAMKGTLSVPPFSPRVAVVAVVAVPVVAVMPGDLWLGSHHTLIWLSANLAFSPLPRPSPNNRVPGS